MISPALRQMALAMALAAIEADGKSLGDLSAGELQSYVDSACADLKLAADALGPKFDDIFQ
jgi:hypothetical protein